MNPCTTFLVAGISYQISCVSRADYHVEGPDLQKTQILACLDYARELAEVEVAA